MKEKYHFLLIIKNKSFYLIFILSFCVFLLPHSNSLAKEEEKSKIPPSPSSSPSFSPSENTSLFPFLNHLELFAGLGPSLAQFKTLSPARIVSPHISGLTKVLYRPSLSSPFAFGIGSYLQFGPFRNITLYANGAYLTGNGFYKSAIFYPFLHYYFHERYKRNYYIALAIVSGLQDFNFHSNIKKTSSSFDESDKICYESRGFSLGIGYSEIENKEVNKHPFFFEFIYRYLRSEQESIVGGTTMEVETLAVTKHYHKVYENTFIMIFGLKIF